MAISFTAVWLESFFILLDTHSEMTYAVKCAARFMFYPKLANYHAIKQIGCYLKATSDKTF